DAVFAGDRGRGRIRVRLGQGPDGFAGVAIGVWVAACGAGADLRDRAGAGPAGGPADVLLVWGAGRLGVAHGGRRLFDASRPGLRTSGPAQLLRTVHPRVLRLEISVWRGHVVRRELVPVGRSADLDVSAV